MSSASSATDSLDLIHAIKPGENATSRFVPAFNSTADLCTASTASVDSAVPTQLAQWVYIQAPQKVATPASVAHKGSASANIVVNPMAPLQIAGLGTNITSKNLPANQNVILAHPVGNAAKPQHLFIQKPFPVVPVSASVASKSALAYLTIKTPQQVGMSVPNQKYVIAPMAKLSSNRLPTTVTTNCVQPKIALMPMSLPGTVCKPVAPKQKIINLKIADGQLQSENTGAITVMCDGAKTEVPTDELEVTPFYREESSNLQRKESVEDKSYELSIVEDSRTDVSFTITIPDEADRAKPPSREPHKLPKHGVSILKKNLNLDAKPEKGPSLIISPVSNSITTISDASTKEVKISTSSNFKSDLPAENKAIPQKPERRRKSNFSYRKDYDEVILTSNGDSSWDRRKSNTDPVVTVTKGNNFPNNNAARAMEDVVEIQVIKDEPDINMNESFDAKKILIWERGIGTLPGSELKFHMNEFGFLEYIQKGDLKQVLDRKIKTQQKQKEELQEEMRCAECGCYGMPSEFISPKYCSYDCQELGNKAAKQKESKLKRRSKAWMRKNDSGHELSEMKIENKEELPSEEEHSTSNENSQDKFSYPWTCTKKGFSWAKYLEHIKAKAVPEKYFKDPFPYNRNGFRPGMKLEGIDPQHPSYFCVLSVAEVIGYRLRLHFDGYSEHYDFWVNADSMDIFPAGWCEKYSHVLHPPPGYSARDFNWNTYLKHTKSTVAPKHLFANRAGSAICPNGFRIGMKLEAVDRKNTSLVCVATVSDMMDNRILVHFDSWDDIYDYWADPMSPYIHPVGWCDQNGHSLTPPNDYPNPETFTWEKYLKETKSLAAPVRAFKQRPVYGFKRGMRLECVDKRVPQLIRAATVDEVKENQLRISFDGWPDRYSYWVDNDSPNIHPVGWCQKTGHPIEPPLTPDDVYDFLECPTVGCRGQGHIKGPQYPSHSSPKDCPYADENMDRENSLPDRLLSPDRQLEAIIPVSREPRDKPKPRLGRPPKIAKRELPLPKVEWHEPEPELDDSKPLKRKCPKPVVKTPPPSPLEKPPKKQLMPLTNGYANPLTEQVWEKHSRHLHDDIRPHVDPRSWKEDEVVRFITSLPYCRSHGALFREHKIDGEALLMLSQRDLVEILNIKLGPAIKLYSVIVLLRRNVA